jgi:hypothetical protein
MSALATSKRKDRQYRPLAGPYSRRLQRGSLGDAFDGRSADGRFVRHLEAELVAHLGGNPSIVQRLLIERLIRIRMMLDRLDDKVGSPEWTPYDSRTYGGLLSAYRLTAREIGLKAVPKPPPTLDDIRASIAREKAERGAAA